MSHDYTEKERKYLEKYFSKKEFKTDSLLNVVMIRSVIYNSIIRKKNKTKKDKLILRYLDDWCDIIETIIV